MKRSFLTAGLLLSVMILAACGDNDAAAAPADTAETETIVESIPEIEETAAEEAAAVPEAEEAEPEEEAPAEDVSEEAEEAVEEPEEEAAEPSGEEEAGLPSSFAESASVDRVIDIDQWGWTEAVPESYFEPSYYPGTVVRFEYETKDYVTGTGEKLTKPAFVYLPCGYDEDDKDVLYDTFYFMHGIDTKAEDLFYDDDGRAKNMLDNMMMNGDIPRMIIISATYDRYNEPTGYDWSLVELGKFHQEFVNDLMPAVEAEFNTWGGSGSDEELKASRDHRGFGGFSLGGVTTWNQFCYNYDYIRYFLPMSGPCWCYSGAYDAYDVDDTISRLKELITENDLNERGYFIYVCTGTQDTMESYVSMLMEPLTWQKDFFTPQHIVYYRKDGGEHDFDATKEYLYNGLSVMFGN
ncbi:MAG: hypothetical protein J6P87_02890 [Lachnospiraceae bacterium]|nr:hypothetical protein [Lachnospiraceae bacterium]